MTWREEAKKLGVPLYCHTLKKLRKKADVLKDIEAKTVVAIEEGVNLLISVREANQICRQALLDRAKESGLKDVALERDVERFIHKGMFLTCKRRGIVIKGKRDDRRKDTGTEGDSTSLSESA